MPAEFIALVTFRWFLALLGVCSNFCLFYVSIRAKWKSKNSLTIGIRFLHGTCNFLIMFNALCLTLLLAFSTVGFVLIISGFGYIPLIQCFYIQALPIFVGNLVLVTMLAIGIDRLLSVTVSMWFVRILNGKNKKKLEKFKKENFSQCEFARLLKNVFVFVK